MFGEYRPFLFSEGSNYGTPLVSEQESIPNLVTLQRGLLNDGRSNIEEVLALATQLLRFAIDDPGVPCPRQAVTLAGQKIIHCDVTDHALSELLRIFIRARNDGQENEVGTLRIINSYSASRDN